MRIAFVSFEYPPDTALGGIATYVHQVGKMLRGRGHEIEVFCASPTRTITETIDGVIVHRVLSTDRTKFPYEVTDIFRERHQANPFDVLESPEYFGDGHVIKKEFPALPLVVKLHTPRSFVKAMAFTYTTPYLKFRFYAGGLLKGKIRHPYWKWKKKETDVEYQLTAMADQIHTPSVSLGDVVSEKWAIDRKRIFNVPYPFIPNEKFLKIPVGSANRKIFTYIGRLEVRKGLVELTKAAQIILNRVPGSKFRLIGRTMESHIEGMTMKEFVQRELASFGDRVEFLSVTPDQIPEILAQTDVCVYPSIWENFPNVCLEAMSAGRAIVASKNGGMKDMLEQPEAGILIDPHQPEEIAEGVIKLLNDEKLRLLYGEAARKKIMDTYSADAIGQLMEKHYGQLLSKKLITTA